MRGKRRVILADGVHEPPQQNDEHDNHLQIRLFTLPIQCGSIVALSERTEINDQATKPPVRALYAMQNSTLFELTRFMPHASTTGERYGSWIFEKDQWVEKDGTLFTLTPVDPLFILVPLLAEKCSVPVKAITTEPGPEDKNATCGPKEGFFISLDQLQSADVGQLRALFSHESSYDWRKQLPLICDTKQLYQGNNNDAPLYRLSVERTKLWIRAKYDQIRAEFSKHAPHAQVEEHSLHQQEEQSSASEGTSVVSGDCNQHDESSKVFESPSPVRRILEDHLPKRNFRLSMKQESEHCDHTRTIDMLCVRFLMRYVSREWMETLVVELGLNMAEILKTMTTSVAGMQTSLLSNRSWQKEHVQASSSHGKKRKRGTEENTTANKKSKTTPTATMSRSAASLQKINKKEMGLRSITSFFSPAPKKNKKTSTTQHETK